MNIVFLCREYDRIVGYGGIGTYVRFISEELKKQGHKIFIISSLPRNKSIIEVKNGIVIYYKKQFRIPVIGRIFYLLGMESVYLRIMCALTNYFVVKSLYNRYKIDIIETPDWFNEGLFCSLFLKNIPVVCRIHGPTIMLYKYQKNKIKLFIEMLMEKIMIESCNAVIVPTLYMLDFVKRNFKIKKFTIIPIGMKADNNYEKKQYHNEKIVLCIGRIEKVKNPQVILKAVPYIVDNIKDVKFIFVGRKIGNYGREFDSLIDKLKINKYVEVIEKMDWQQLNKLCLNSDVIVKPSLEGALDMTLIESIASKVPLVCSNIPSFKEVIGEEAGILVNPYDEKSWAENIIKVLTDKTMADNIAMKAFELYRNKYSIEKIAEKLISFYQEILYEYFKKYRL